MKILGSKVQIGGSAVLLAWVVSCQSSLGQNQQYSWSTIAGQTLAPGYLDGTNGNTKFANPWAITSDSQGSLYVAEFGDIRQIQKIGSDWVVTTLPLTNGIGSFQWIAADNSANLFTTYQIGGPLLQAKQTGMDWGASQIAPDCTYPFTNVFDCWTPGQMVADNKGSLFVTDRRYHTIKQMNFDGTNWFVKTIAGMPNVNPVSVDGTNDQASFSQIMGITVDRSGNLYVTEYEQNTVRRIAPQGADWVVTTIAGSAGAPYAEVDGTNQQARFSLPWAIATDSKGAVYVLDQTNPNGGATGSLRKLTPVGTDWVVTTIPVDNPELNGPTGLAVDTSDNVYIADTGNCTIRLGVPLPSLQVVRKGSQIIVSWPSSASNYALESTSTLNDSQSWIPVTNGVTIVGNSFTMTNQLGGSGMFFRLRQQ